VKVIAGNSTGP